MYNLYARTILNIFSENFIRNKFQIFVCQSLTCISCLVMLLLDMALIPQSSPQTSQYPGNILSPHQSTQLAQLYHS